MAGCHDKKLYGWLKIVLISCSLMGSHQITSRNWGSAIRFCFWPATLGDEIIAKSLGRKSREYLSKL